MTKQNRTILVTSFTLTFVITMFITSVSNKVDWKQNIHAAPSGQASYFDNICTVNMSADRTIWEMNTDFLWCLETYETGNKIDRDLSSTSYSDGSHCVVVFNDHETEDSAFELWIECTFDHLEYLASIK